MEGAASAGPSPSGQAAAVRPEVAQLLERLIEGQLVLQKAVTELVAANASSSAQESSELTLDTDYQDKWPDVEVTVAVHKLDHFSIGEFSIEAQIEVHLDWVDPQLRPEIHYNYNPEHGTFELSKALRGSSNPFRFFNPQVCIENAKSLEDDPANNGDDHPRIVDEIVMGGREMPHLTKSFRFAGCMNCRDIDAKCFPFDVEQVSIRIVGVEMEGMTTTGMSRDLVLLEPTLRRKRRFEQKTDAVRGYAVPLGDDVGMPHMWRIEDDGRARDVGEMAILAVGGTVTHGRSAYVLHVMMSRRWFPSYTVSFAIACLQVVGAGFSLWVPFTPDMLANRMSITLTVLLTLVAGNAARPPVIESVPYPTLHDHYGQCMLFFVASVIAVANLVVFTSCWGMYRGNGANDGQSNYDFFDRDLHMVVNKLSDYWWCEPGPVETSWADFIVLVLTGSFLVLVNIVIIVIAQLHRVTALLRVKHIVDTSNGDMSDDMDGLVFSKLVLCNGNGHFQKLKRDDFFSFMGYVHLLPVIFPVRAFWKAWRCCRRLQRGCCRCSAFARPSGFHPLDSLALLMEADDRARSSKGASEGLGKLSVGLTPADIVRLLDVGSGEMGFYTYWYDQASERVKVEGVSDAKLKYNKGKTFMDQYVFGADESEQLAGEIIRRMKLDSRPNGWLRRRQSQGALGSAALGSAAKDIAGFGQNLITRGIGMGAFPLRAVASMGDTATGAGQDDLPGAVPESQDSTSPVSPGVGEEDRSVSYVLMCLTGSNRQMLRDEDNLQKLDQLLRSVNLILRKYGVEVVAHTPADVDEAMYELWATEWVVQHGDLDVTGFKLSPVHRTLQGGRLDASATLGEVTAAFADLRADADLAAMYRRAAQAWSNEGLAGDAGSPTAGSSEATVALPDTSQVPCMAIYKAFETDAKLMRALLRARLFAGTLSAGSGSSQVTLRRAESLESSMVHSIPLGNRTPLVSMKLTQGHEEAFFAKNRPRTRVKARELLCGPGPMKDTRPAWTEDGPVEPKRLALWGDLVEACAEENNLPTQQRGLFVGISAVFHAASEAKCDGLVLERDDFIERLERRRDELVAEGSKAGRALSNITLVLGLVRTVLHRSALIVCKRKWKIACRGEETADFLATWTLGFYLKQTGVLNGHVEGAAA